MPRAIVAVTNDLSTDNRVHRTCTVLQELGYDVLLVGRALPGSLPLDRPYATRRMRLLFRRGALFYAEYNVRLFLLLLFARCGLVVANDLDTLLASFVTARMRGKELVYDSHEFYTEVPELVGRPAVRRVWLAIERWIFTKLQHVITVNDSIANAYAERYGKRPAVVRNIPMPRELGPLPTRRPSRAYLSHRSHHSPRSHHPNPQEEPTRVEAHHYEVFHQCGNVRLYALNSAQWNRVAPLQ